MHSFAHAHHDKVSREPELLPALVVAAPPAALLLVHVADDRALVERVLVVLVRLVVVHRLEFNGTKGWSVTFNVNFSLSSSR